jgi:hypothetical protein
VVGGRHWAIRGRQAVPVLVVRVGLALPSTNVIREIGLRNGLVDVKVCAVDETWSGLKFVYKIKDRR